MSISIRQIFDKDHKTEICKTILADIPEWFGIDEANKHYASYCRNQVFFGAFDDSIPIGLLTIEFHFSRSAEIYLMGIIKRYHRQGIGRQLVVTAEKYLTAKEYRLLQVKTLGKSYPDNNYAKTRQFYQSIGFEPVEELIEFWDKLPCLLLVKTI